VGLPRLLFSENDLLSRVKELGEELTDVLDNDAVVVGVLRGCLPFLADLIRSINLRLEVDFVSLSAFAPDSGRVRLTRDLGIEISGRQVLLVEDMVDTGLRLDFLQRHLWGHEAAEVRSCTLFDRRDRRVLPVPVDYSGFVIEEPFVVGYGLDHHGLFRNLPAVVAVDPSELDEILGDPSNKCVAEIRSLVRTCPHEGSRVIA